MALDVEDGTGRATAESYISVADADTYFTARGNAVWAAADVADKEQALRKGTDYMEGVYRPLWKGYRTYGTQALCWPRQNVPIEDTPQQGFVYPTTYVGPNAIPPEVKKACSELAVRALSGDLAPDVARVPSMTRVGDIEVQYDPSEPVWTRFRAVDNIVRIFLSRSGASAPIVRT